VYELHAKFSRIYFGNLFWVEKYSVENTAKKTAVFRPHCIFLDLYQKSHSETKVGHTVAQLVEALRYKPEGRGFDSRWYHWHFSLT
jgi:hypothetical protein